jgi:hypothetical protein
VIEHDEIGGRIVAAVGETGARELLDAITRPEADRAALIGRLVQRNDAAWLAELLTDREVDEVARLRMVEALRCRDPRPIAFGRRRALACEGVREPDDCDGR